MTLLLVLLACVVVVELHGAACRRRSPERGRGRNVNPLTKLDDADRNGIYGEPLWKAIPFLFQTMRRR